MVILGFSGKEPKMEVLKFTPVLCVEIHAVLTIIIVVEFCLDQIAINMILYAG